MIFSIKSSPPTMSAPDSFASFCLSSSATTATLIFFPVPLGKLTAVLILISFFFVYYLLKYLNQLTHQILLYNFFLQLELNYLLY